MRELLPVVLLLPSCGDATRRPFHYPLEGEHGVNVLNLTVVSARADESLSFRAEADPELSLRVTMLLLSEIPAEPGCGAGIWCYFGNSTWAVSKFDRPSGSQRFLATWRHSVDVGVSDLGIQFGGTGSVRIDYFEDGQVVPTRSKILDWE